MQNRALRGCLIAVVFVFGMGIAASKEMHPKLPNNKEEIQNPEAKEQRGAVPPIIVNVSPPAKTHDEIEQEAKEHEDKADNDRKLVEFTRQLAYYTLGLFIATGTLVIATGCLAYLGWRQARDMKESLAIAKESADAAMKSALVAEQTLYGTEAPFIFIIIAPTHGDAIVTVASPQGVEYPEHVSCTFHNYGRSPAIIREIYLTCITSYWIPDPCPFPPLQSHFFQSEIVGPNGSSQPNALPQIASFLPNDGKIHRGASVFVSGQVRYADVFGNQYLSGFCYAFNARSNKFYAIGGANHNYRRKLNEDENREAEKRDIPPFHGV
jgi:hypothetical protein